MGSIGERISQARKKTGLSQGDLGDKCGWENGQKRISNYERDVREPGFSEVAKIARVLGINAAFLAFGGEQSSNDANSEYYETSVVDLPVLSINKDENIVQSIKSFQTAELGKAGVQPQNAAIVIQVGNTMAPLLPEGSELAIDTSSTAVKDGELYLVQHYDMLRVAFVYRIPGGFRLKFSNEQDWPAENIEGSAAENLQVVGRVFWYSVNR